MDLLWKPQKDEPTKCSYTLIAERDRKVEEKKGWEKGGDKGGDDGPMPKTVTLPHNKHYLSWRTFRSLKSTICVVVIAICVECRV